MSEKGRTSTYSSEIANAVHYNTWVLSAFRKFIRGRVLEIGVAHGSFFGLLPKEMDYFGLDIDERHVADARERGLTAFLADIADPALREKTECRAFETILCFNVLEHVENDKFALENLSSLLAPGGHLCLFVPAFNALFSQMDSLAGHYRRYTKRSLLSILPSGTRVEKMHYFNPIGGVGWWLNKFLKKQTLDDASVNSQIRLFDKYIYPFPGSSNLLRVGFLVNL